MGENEFNFWNDHSDHFLKMAFGYEHRESIENPDGYGKHALACGDTVEVFFKIKGGRLDSISYDMNGCIYTNACMNTVVHLARGKTPQEAWRLTPDHIVGFLETLPPKEYHCAGLAVTAMRRALSDYLEIRRSPWKKVYR